VLSFKNMKTKFLLMLIALNGLVWGVNSASAYTLPTDHDTARLSQTISGLVGFDRDTHSLVALAIDRALLAQVVNQPPVTSPRTAGVPLAPPQPTRIDGQQVTAPNPQSTQTPYTTGKMGVPAPSIGQTRVNKPKKPKTQPSASPPSNQ
jgi:hypothetical protein